MAKVKLKDQLGRVINIDGEATKGATVGRDLYGPDGKVLKASDILNPAPGNASAVATIWKLIREVPANIKALAALAGKGVASRQASGDWALRTLQPGAGIQVTNGDGDAGDPSIGLADLAATTAGTLQAITRDAKGRVSGVRSATITGTAQQIDVANGNAAAGLPTLSLASEAVASLALADSAVQEVVAGPGVSVDDTDPQRPVISATGSGGFAPYFIPAGQQFVVPEYQQALFTLPIEISDGASIELSGALEEVA